MVSGRDVEIAHQLSALATRPTLAAIADELSESSLLSALRVTHDKMLWRQSARRCPGVVGTATESVTLLCAHLEVSVK